RSGTSQPVRWGAGNLSASQEVAAMLHSVPSSRSAVSVPEQVLLGLLFLAGVALLSLPAARGVSATFGWMPLWLLGLPGMALAMAFLLRRRASQTLTIDVASRRQRRRQVTDPAVNSRRPAGAVPRRRRRPQAA